MGNFQGQAHPVKKSKDAKHNPLQRLTYLGLSALLLPLQMITGLLYYIYNDWHKFGLAPYFSLDTVAVIHMGLAFLVLSFIVVHVYMTSTGHTVFAHVAAMISGWEEVEEGAEVEDWEKAEYIKEKG